MKKYSVPNNERGFAFSRVDVLRPDGPSLDVEIAADNNVMKITNDCLFMRTATGSINGGRRSMSWWGTVGTIFTWAFFTASFIYFGIFDEMHSNTFLQEFVYLCYLMPIIASVWFLIPWRRQLPIIFNRKTGKITFIFKKQVISKKWYEVEYYIKDLTTFAAGGAPVNEGLLTLVVDYRNHEKNDRPESVRISIKGTEDHLEATLNRGIYGAAMIWEYIRLFMHKGDYALPPIEPITKYRLDHINESFREFNPFKVLTVKFYWWPIAIPFFIFIALPCAPLIILGDLLYMALDRILPRRKWPEELLEACDYVWDGKGS